MTNKLFRSRDNKVISGVCGGLGTYFEIDPLIFRFGFVAFLLAGGSSLVIYLWLLIVIPKEPVVVNSNSENPNTTADSFDKFQQEDLASIDADNNTKTIFGLLLISGGALILLNNLVPMINLKKIWPAILIIIGIGLLLQKSNKEDSNDKI